MEGIHIEHIRAIKKENRKPRGDGFYPNLGMHAFSEETIAIHHLA
jgi:hypothetical protein